MVDFDCGISVKKKKERCLNIPQGGEGEQEMPRDVWSWKIGDIVGRGVWRRRRGNGGKNIANYI